MSPFLVIILLTAQRDRLDIGDPPVVYFEPGKDAWIGLGISAIFWAPVFALWITL